MIARVLSPEAELPQRLLPSMSISNEEPAEKLQSGCTLKVSLNCLLLALTGSLRDPGRLPSGKILLMSKVCLLPLMVCFILPAPVPTWYLVPLPNGYSTSISWKVIPGA